MADHPFPIGPLPFGSERLALQEEPCFWDRVFFEKEIRRKQEARSQLLSHPAHDPQPDDPQT